MNLRRILLIVLAAMLPYVALSALGIIFLSVKIPEIGMVMESVFQNKMWYLIASVLLFALSTVVFSAVCYDQIIKNNLDALSVFKTATIVKLIQISGYILILILSLLMVLTVFTIPFSIGLCLLDCLSLVSNGFIAAAAAINALRKGQITRRGAFQFTILQLIFCADVLVSIILFQKLKKN